MLLRTNALWLLALAHGLIDLLKSFTEPVAAGEKVSIAPILLAIPFALYGFFLRR